MEVFVRVENFPSYLIGDQGTVLSLNYRGNTGRTKEMGKYVQRDGYQQVELYKNGEGKRITVHRLVAKHFVRKPEGKNEIDHINNDKTDNRAENLRWVTRGENVRNAFEEGLYENREGENSNTAKLTEEEVVEIRRLYEKTEKTQYDLADMYGVSQVQIGRIVRRETWTNLS